MKAEAFTIGVNGATLAAVQAGEGLPVVFLHAGVCDKRMWEAQMAAVAEDGWQAIAYDRRGYGDSESADVSFSHIDDLDAVLRQLEEMGGLTDSSVLLNVCKSDWGSSS